jgi:hypothetical protein
MSPGAFTGLESPDGNETDAEVAFSGLHADRFLLEYDDERAGSFEPLRFVPKDKIVALGLISSKTPELEPQDLLIRRIEEASKYVPLENLAFTPQCGFASLMHGNPLTWDDQRRKLDLLIDTAKRFGVRSYRMKRSPLGAAELSAGDLTDESLSEGTLGFQPEGPASVCHTPRVPIACVGGDGVDVAARPVYRVVYVDAVSAHHG